MKICGLVLAAGMAKRMGTSKQMLKIGDKTMIETTVDSLMRGGAEKVVVVTGCYADQVEAVLGEAFGDSVIFARNEDYATTDMLHSIRLGLAKMPECDAFYLIPGDMPKVAERTFEKLLAVFGRYAEGIRPYVIFPTYQGHREHPPVIDSRLIDTIMYYGGEGGLRQLWRVCGAGMIEVPVGDTGVFTDVDTPEDYRKLLENHKVEVQKIFQGQCEDGKYHRKERSSKRHL